MQRTQNSDRPERPSRRAALRRLAGAVVSAYVVPEVLFLSAARAEGSSSSFPSAPTGSSSEPSTPSTPSGASAPSGSTTPTSPSTSAPSGSESSSSSGGASDAEEAARETCSVPDSQGQNTISISRSDLVRSQEAVEAGAAKPLDEIWGNFISEYDGKVIGVEFLDRRNITRYRFRAISKTGRLETVTISAQTGAIERIVGC